jgi:hypothetical protein
MNEKIENRNLKMEKRTQALRGSGQARVPVLLRRLLSAGMKRKIELLHPRNALSAEFRFSSFHFRIPNPGACWCKMV